MTRLSIHPNEVVVGDKLVRAQRDGSDARLYPVTEVRVMSVTTYITCGMPNDTTDSPFGGSIQWVHEHWEWVEVEREKRAVAYTNVTGDDWVMADEH